MVRFHAFSIRRRPASRPKGARRITSDTSGGQGRGRPVRAAVIGYYGRWNLGDDLMARDFAVSLAGHGREARLLIGDAYLDKIVSGPGVTTAPRSGLALFRALIWCDELVFAGGTIFHDSYGDAEARRYIRHLWTYAALLHAARLLGKKVRLVGVGVGPLRRDTARQAAAVATGAAHTIYVRDQASRDEVAGLQSFDPDAIIVGPDLAWLGADHLSAAGRGRAPEARLGLSLLDMAQFLEPDVAETFWTPVRKAIARKLEADPDLHLTIFAFWTAPGRPGDHAIARRFVQNLPEAVRPRAEIFAYSGDPDALVDKLATCRAILATRFHAAVLAQALGRPYAVISYNRKVSDFADAQGLPKALRLPGDHPADLAAAKAVIDALLTTQSTPDVDSAEAARQARTAVRQALEVDG